MAGVHLDFHSSVSLTKLHEDKPTNNQKFNELISYNMDNGFKNVESDLKNLDVILKKKNAMDKRNKVLYGGHGVFPS